MDALLDASGHPGDVRAIGGYLGNLQNGVRRLYRSLDLDEYLEIPDAQTHHSVKIAEVEGTELTRTVVWVERNAVLRHVVTRSVPAHSDFFQGSIAGSGSCCCCGGAPNPCAPVQPCGPQSGGSHGGWGDPTSRYPCLSPWGGPTSRYPC